MILGLSTLGLPTTDSRLPTTDYRLFPLRASAHLPPGDAFLGGALRRLRFGGVRRFGRGARIGLLAAADPLGGGAQASAHALGLRLLGVALGVALGLGARVVLAAHELDVGDLGAVALAVAAAQQPCIA